MWVRGLLFGLLLLGLTGCNLGPLSMGEANLTDPQDIISQAKGKMQGEVDSFHFHLEAKAQGLESTATISSFDLKGDGDAVRPSKISWSGTLSADASSAKTEIIIIEDKGWVRSGDGKWEQSNDFNSFFNFLVPVKQGGEVEYKDITKLGDEAVNGENCYHLKVSTDPGQLGGDLKSLDGEIWISKGDLRYRQVKLGLSLPSISSLEISAQFLNFNEYKGKIEEPKTD